MFICLRLAQQLKKEQLVRKILKLLRMYKKKIILISFLIIFLLLIFLGIIFYLASEFSKSTNIQETFPSSRAETFTISSGESYPVFFKELIIDPAASPILSTVKEGEKQTYSIWIKDPVGIAKMTGKINTDTGEEALDFKLVEGPDTEGRWQASWITKDISLSNSYNIFFEATNKMGSTTKSQFNWYVQQ